MPRLLLRKGGRGRDLQNDDVRCVRCLDIRLTVGLLIVGRTPTGLVQIEASIADETLYCCNSKECKKEAHVTTSLLETFKVLLSTGSQSSDILPQQHDRSFCKLRLGVDHLLGSLL